MLTRLSVGVFASFALAACGGGGYGGGAAAPAALAYSVPNPATVTYLMADSSFIDMDAMGQVMQVTQGSSATVSTAFARSDDGVQVTLTFEDFSARLSQPMGAPMTADESGIQGPLVYSIDRMGNAVLESEPRVTGNAVMLFAAEPTAHSFLPGLPGTGVSAGDMWTDTVSFKGDQGMGQTDLVTISEYTVVGDTVVDGRTLLRIDIEATTSSETQATIEGVDVFQSMSGASLGHMLWDLQAGIMYERILEAEGEGTTEVSMAPMPMGMSVRGKSVMRLVSR